MKPTSWKRRWKTYIRLMTPAAKFPNALDFSTASRISAGALIVALGHGMGCWEGKFHMKNL